MADLADLIRWRDSLLQSRLSGLREVVDSNGERITYKSDSEMAAALQVANEMIDMLTNGNRPKTITFCTSKGI